MDHHIHPLLLTHRVKIALVGVGGNGSQMLTGLARLNHAITALGHPGLHVTAYDDDQVSVSNVGRQLFSRADVGLNKATVLVHRVNVFYGTDWEARPHRYGEAGPGNDANILITCVDSKAARQSIDHKINNSEDWRRPYYHLDLGNREADGQMVIGEPKSQKNRADVPRLPTVMELFSEMAEPPSPRPTPRAAAWLKHSSGRNCSSTRPWPPSPCSCSGNFSDSERSTGTAHSST